MLDKIHQYQDQIVHVLTWLGSLGILDVILRKIPTEKPRSILLIIQSICQAIDKVIDAIPGMKQNVK